MTIDGSPQPENDAPDAGRSVAKRSPVNRRFAALVRWLHIYVSMLAFTIVLFFSVTGLTLNHADWFFGESERRLESPGAVDVRWLRAKPNLKSDAAEAGEELADQVNKLEVVEHLRRTHEIRGVVSEFSVDDQQCVVVFKGPGYGADALIDRDTGKYEVIQSWHGMVAIINDLHKGRDTGTAWSWVIDLSALLTSFISLTGLVLLFYLKQRRGPGLIVAVFGTIVVVAVFRLCVP